MPIVSTWHPSSWSPFLSIEHSFAHADSVRFIRISGNVRADDFERYGQELLSSNKKSHRISFVDLSNVTFWDIRFEDVLRHTNAISDAIKERGGNFTEIVLAPTDLTFGIARMYETVSNNRYTVLIFRDESEANRKLQELLSDVTNLKST